MRNSLFNLIVMVVLAANGAASQVFDQENITVLPFSGWSASYSSEVERFQDALTDKIVTRIIQSHRFNVIDRANLSSLLMEQDLHMTGVIDESTVMEVGSIIGVDKFIMGTFTRNSTEYHKDVRSEGETIVDAYYTADIQATIKMLDVESARYIEAAEAAGHGKGPDETNALLNALDELADSVITSFEQYFAIQAFITSIDKATATLDRGTSYGVKEGMNFTVWNVLRGLEGATEIINFGGNTREVGLLRVVSVEANTARGRFIGNYDDVRSGYLIRETKKEVKVEAQILEKKMKQVTLNIGRAMGIKPGATFSVISKGEELIDPVTGEVYGEKTRSVGTIYITESEDRFSRGKVVKGFYSVKKGMLVKEQDMSIINLGLSVSFAPLLPSFKPNDILGTYTIDAQYTGTHEVEIDYSGYDEISSGSIFEIDIYARSLVSGLSMGLTYDRYQYSDMLGAMAIGGYLGYYLDLIPEIVYLSSSVGIAYGNATQELPDNLVSTLSDNESSKLFSSALPLSAQIGIRGKLGRIVLFAGGSYRLWEASEWSYWTKTGEKTDSGGDEKEIVEIDPSYVLYPKVNLGSLYMKFGVALEL